MTGAFAAAAGGGFAEPPAVSPTGPASYTRPNSFAPPPPHGFSISDVGSSAAGPPLYAREPYGRKQSEGYGPISAREIFNRQTAAAEASAVPGSAPPLPSPIMTAPDAPNAFVRATQRLIKPPPALMPDLVNEVGLGTALCALTPQIDLETRTQIATVRAHRFGQLWREDLATSAAARRSLRELALREADGRLASETTRLAEQQLERFSLAATPSVHATMSFGALG